MQPSRLNLQAGGPGFGGADLAATCSRRVSPACILQRRVLVGVIAVNAAVILMLLSSGRNGGLASRSGAAPAPAASSVGRAPTNRTSAPTNAAVEPGSPPYGLPAAVFALFDAIGRVESQNNDLAIGDRGRSHQRLRNVNATLS